MTFLRKICGLAMLLSMVACPNPYKDICKDNKCLVVTPDSGFGNRLRGIASAAVMAKQTNRVLVINWRSAKGEIAARSFNDLFQNDVPPFGGVDIPSGTSEKKFSLAEFKNTEYIKALNEDFATIWQAMEQIVYSLTWYGYAPSNMPFEQYMADYIQFYRDLRPVQSVQEAVDNFAGENFVAQDDMVGVAFRTWNLSADWPREKSDAVKVFIQKGRELFKVKMDEAIKKNPNTKFFLATDDLSATDYFREIYGDRIIKYPFTEVKRETLQDQLNSMIDWYLLTKTNYLIGTFQSSFSDEAALLTKSARKINIGPNVFGLASAFCFDKEGKIYPKPYLSTPEAKLYAPTCAENSYWP